MGRSKSVPSRRQETGTIVGAAALANSSHLSAHAASSVEEEQHPPPPSTLAMATAAASAAAPSGQQERVSISPTSPARSRSTFGDGPAAAAASASAVSVVTPEKEGKKSVAKRKSRSSASSTGNRARLRRVAFADAESSQGRQNAKGDNTNGVEDDDESVLFDREPRQGSGISGRMVIDDDDDDYGHTVDAGTSANARDARRRIYFDEEDEEDDEGGDVEKRQEGDSDGACIEDSVEVRIVQKEEKPLIYVASPPPADDASVQSMHKDISSHELLRLRLSHTQVVLADNGVDTGSVRGPIALSSAKAVESLIELWSYQSTEIETSSCDVKPLDIAAICRAFEGNLFDIFLENHSSGSCAHVSIRFSQTCFDMCCASQLNAPPIPVPRKLPGNSDRYSKPHPSYTLMLALGTIFKGSVLEDVASALVKGGQKSKAGGGDNNDVITAKMVYSAVDNSHAAEFEAPPVVQMNIPGLVPTLRPYQEAAVKWMLKREGKGDDEEVATCIEWELSWVVIEGPSLGASFGVDNGIRSDICSLIEWRESKKISLTSSEAVTFCNAFTGWIASSYDEARYMTVGSRDGESSKISGGVLAESMGLGKSCEIISLMLANPCPLGVYSADLPDLINPIDDGASAGAGAGAGADDQEKTNDSPIDEENLEVVQDEKRQRMNNINFQQQKKKKMHSTKPLALHDAVCICGRNSSYLDSLSWVVCEACGEALHGRCAGFVSEEMLLASTKAGDQAQVCSSNHCPSCVATRGQIVKSRATLIVTPPAILAQWQSEINRHTLDPQTGRPLKVVVYPGMRELCSLESSKPHAHFPLVHPRTLADADVVLMSFSALMGDLSHSDDNPFAGLGSKSGAGSRLRSRKRYRVVPSPLSSIYFWRVCLDEAQKVEAPTAASAKMARKIEARHRWCVSGTPIGRGKLDDLFGLLLFLQTPKPFDDLGWFKSSFLLSQGDALKRLSHLLRNVMWRSTKDNDAVRRQMGIPEQEERKVTLQFSTVEKYFYEKQLQATMDVAERVMKSSDASTTSGGGSGVSGRSVGVRARRAKARDLDSLNNLLQKLRAACCHPQVGTSGISLRRHGPGHHQRDGGSVADRVLTMDEILDKLIDDAKGKCEEAQRITVLYTNGLASLMRLKAEAIGEGRAEIIGQNSNDITLRLLEKSASHYQDALDLTTTNAAPTEAIGSAELRGSTGFHSNRTIIRDGAASLGWKFECSNASNDLSGASFNQAWCSFSFSGAAKIINSIKVRPVVTVPKDLSGNASAEGWTILRPKDCVLQMSSAAMGGEFVDIHRFNLSDEEHDGAWKEISGFFSPSRSKTWRLVVETYHSAAGGYRRGRDIYFTGIDIILLEPEIAPDNLQCLHALTNAAIVRSSLIRESSDGAGDNDGDTCAGDNAGDEDSAMPSIKERIKSMEKEAEALSSNYLAHARAVHERSHARLQLAIEAREVTETNFGSLSDASNPWYQDLLAWSATQGSESDKRILCDMVRSGLSSHQATLQNAYQRLEVRNKNSSMAKLEHCLVRRGQFADFSSVDGLNVALAMRIQQGEAELNLKKDEDMATCISTVSNLSSKPSDREVFENSHCKRCREDWHQKGPVCGHCHLEDTIVKLTKQSNDPELDCVCRSIHRFIQHRLSSTKKGAQENDGETEFLESLHQRGLRYFELQDKRRHEVGAAKIKWKSHFDLMSDIDELQQCKQTSRLLSSDDVISELTEQEAAFIVDPNNIAAEIMENELKQASAQRELRIHKDSLRYLKNQRAERKVTVQSTSSGEDQGDDEVAVSVPDSCAVCLSDLQGERSVLRCGHCFHQECLERLVSRAGGGSIVRCPMRCRVTTRTEDVFLATDMRKDDGSQQRRQVKGQYGVKVDRLVGDVLDMIDAGERGIVFSQWEDMLDVVATALSKNEVSYIRPRSGRRFGDDINRYKCGDCPVLLMNVKNGAEGLTIVEANHVYMLEPLLNSGLDLQAVSRISRIGQRQKTYLHRYVVDNTVEVNIDKIRMERQSNHFEDDILEQQKHSIKGGGIDGGFDVSELHQLFG